MSNGAAGGARRRSSESVLACLHSRSRCGRWANRRVGITEETRERVGWTLRGVFGIESMRLRRSLVGEIEARHREVQRDLILCFSGCQKFDAQTQSQYHDRLHPPLTKPCNLTGVARNFDVARQFQLSRCVWKMGIREPQPSEN